MESNDKKVNFDFGLRVIAGEENGKVNEIAELKMPVENVKVNYIPKELQTEKIEEPAKEQVELEVAATKDIKENTPEKEVSGKTLISPKKDRNIGDLER